MPLPSERPISGSRFGPKITSRATSRMTSSVTPIPKGMDRTVPPFLRAEAAARPCPAKIEGIGRARGAFRGGGDRLRWRHEAALKAARRLEKRDHKLGVSGDQEPARRARGRHRDRQGRRPRRRPEREARDHGPERLRQVDPRLRADGPPVLRDHRGRDPARRCERRPSSAPTCARRRASSSPSSTRTRSPASPSPTSSGARSTRSGRRRPAARTIRSRSRSSARRSSPRWSG